MVKIVWLDLNSSYAHSSLALPALHAQIKEDTNIEWAVVSATINEQVGPIINKVYQNTLSYAQCVNAKTEWIFPKIHPV